MLAPESGSPVFWRPLPRAAARLRLLCFHHAGGSSRSFAPWLRQLPGDVELLALELPGRGTRAHERGLSSAQAVLEELDAQVPPLLDRPYALFGHSMGGQFAYHLTVRLLSAGRPPPCHLFVSASPPPLQFDTDANARLAQLSDQQLAARLRTLGGTPAALLEDWRTRERVLTFFRQDLSLCASMPRTQCLLPVPLSVLGARGDAFVPFGGLQDWQECTSRRFRFHSFEGDHFYFSWQLAAVVSLLCREIEEDRV